MATITLVGAVPSQAAKDRLQTLAIANSKTPAAVDNELTIDPTVPIGIGVRVVELTSARFPSGDYKVMPAHAKELDRVVAVMQALPNVTVLVIGHADQIGSAQSNLMLSEARALAVVAYLVNAGITPSRLSSRAVGDSDLLSLNNDAQALALNRRTEFVFYGLLIG
ncbi:MAG: OmpA family protein [Ilumatobacteraceae bacterium]